MSSYQRRLPHLHPNGQPLFITWRLKGSLPPNRFFPAGSLSAGKTFLAMDRLLDQALQSVGARGAAVWPNSGVHRGESGAGWVGRDAGGLPVVQRIAGLWTGSRAEARRGLKAAPQMPRPLLKCRNSRRGARSCPPMFFSLAAQRLRAGLVIPQTKKFRVFCRPQNQAAGGLACTELNCPLCYAAAVRKAV